MYNIAKVSIDGRSRRFKGVCAFNALAISQWLCISVAGKHKYLKGIHGPLIGCYAETWFTEFVKAAHTFVSNNPKVFHDY